MIMHKRLESIRNITTSITAAALLGGCLSDSVNTPSSDALQTEVNLSGSVGDGPVVGANMRVRADGGDLIAEFQSDANAGYNITINTQAQFYPLTIEATGGTDLVTNTAPDFDMTGVLIESTNSGIANVNPFSTFSMALARELSGGMTRENLRVAQETVVDALNSGLNGLASTGPNGTRIDETNISEMVKSSETLAELVRRTRDLLQAAGFSTNGAQVVSVLASDISDRVVDGVGGSNADRRTAAVSTIVNAQVLLESMANELHVNGLDASDAMRAAIDQVSPAPPTTTIDELPVTAGMISKTRVGLAAAYSVAADPAILQLHTVVSGIQPGQSAMLVGVILPADYRGVLQNALSTIASADDATLDLVNAVARTGGDIDATNLAPSIQGVPASSVVADSPYSFTPVASDSNGDVLTFDIAILPSWASFNTLTGELFGTPAMSDVGTYPDIGISVSDGEFSANLAPFTISVTANNTAPQISGTSDTSVNVGGNYSFTPTASDPENDTLTFDVTGLPSWASFNTSTGQLSGTPQAGDVGTYSNIVISVSDGEFSASLAAFTITVTANNTAPQISGLAPTGVNVGGNYSFTPTASDPENDTLTFSVTALPSWASFSTSSGQVSGTPQSGDVGTSSNIVITVSDGDFSASLAAFTITVSANNSPPQISGSAPTGVNVGGNYSFTPTASDPENDTLTFSVTALPSWASFSTSSGQVSGTPQSGDVGTSSNIVISVSDGEFSASLAAFTITVSANNSPPQISGSAPTGVNVGGNYSFTPTASDPENDTLTFSVTALPSWASFSTSSGQVSGTPQSGDVGTSSNIVITVSDGEFSASLAAFTITVSANNSPPQISGSAPTGVNVGGNYSFTPTASDPENDTLTFSVSGLPSWASFSTSTGQISGTPQSGDVGTYSNIVITVSDGEFSASLSAFTITVSANNSPPQISGSAPTGVNVGGSYTFTPTASDPENDTLTFSVTGLPLWASFSTSSGQVSGTPQSGDVGTYSNIIITVSDGQANASLGAFSITVQAVSLGSVTLTWTAPTLNEDGTTLTDLDGYRIYWGTTPGIYPNSVTIDNESVLMYVVDNLAPGTYVFVATSFNTAGEESRYSGMATKVVP